MGKHEPMSAKAIANKIKSKGLQKLKYYCQMCQKQCRDSNGFKCHIQSEAHQRQALIVHENTGQFVQQYSQEFHDNFMYILKTRYRHEKILANTIFQEYIKDKQHVHLNATRWLTLTDFANWLAEIGEAKVEESDRGVLITYIDNDPQTLKRRELDKIKAEQARIAAERVDKEIKTQMELSKMNIDKERRNLDDLPKEIQISETESSFNIKPFSISKAATSKYQPMKIIKKKRS